ncbi:MAG: hypothetical protein JW982_08875 [Spirochaetes bacterium]|nr:hypothetical protein [Spirochaetota bacterium]
MLLAAAPVKLERNQFSELLFNFNNLNPAVEIYLTGKTEKSGLSFNNYIYYEIISYNKDTSYSIDYIFENSFNILWKNYSINVNYRNIRTFLKPQYSETISSDTCYKKTLEYGLLPGKKYYLLPHTDTYYLNEPDGSYVEKTNTIFYISDQPFNKSGPQIPITPAFQGWTY